MQSGLTTTGLEILCHWGSSLFSYNRCLQFSFSGMYHFLQSLNVLSYFLFLCLCRSFIGSALPCILGLRSTSSALCNPMVRGLLLYFLRISVIGLEEISRLSRPIVFLYFFVLIAEEGFLISSCYSLELCINLTVSSLKCSHVHMCVHVCVHLFVCVCACRDGAGRDSAGFTPARVPLDRWPSG